MLERITDSSNFIAKNAKYVKIDYKKLKEFASGVQGIRMKHWLSNNPFGILDLPIDKLVNFLLLFESIDFSFWGNPKWSIKDSGKVLDGSICLLYALLKYVKSSNNYDFSKMSFEEFSIILKGNVEIPLLFERHEIITSVSKIVNKKMGGNFYNYIKDIHDDKELFNIIVDNFSNFKDERIYNGKKVYFYKLAQLLVSDILSLRQLKENISIEISHLVGCADYKIPQVLRGLGITIYDDELSKLIDNKAQIEEGSIYEVEIRGCMLYVISELARLTGKCPIEINDYLFSKRNSKDVNSRPYHLTRTVNY